VPYPPASVHHGTQPDSPLRPGLQGVDLAGYPDAGKGNYENNFKDVPANAKGGLRQETKAVGGGPTRRTSHKQRIL
jgi:hypothetical protein